MVLSLCAVSLLAAPAHARLANWYPETQAEQLEQMDTLNVQLQDLDSLRENQLADRSRAEEVMADLLDQLQIADEDLKNYRKPLAEASERYRRIQSVGVTDPLVNLEGERQLYLQIKNEREAGISDRQERINWLNQQIRKAAQNLTDARQRMTVTLSQIDRLWKHREIISKLVFVRVVND
ncbi:hypothetical protein [Candidatus Magnetaquicoccus inordinatus]|uniref:hypothetical protein n=1 Tax=Candidatus Magnetaquicoccus inordinatus TaxID=2496818 RepID=UPI00102C8DC1|nr:hypothetical protein [Candidatus Magnetaquicoccus inordinatus]